MFIEDDNSVVSSGMHHLYKLDAVTGAPIWRSSSLGSYTQLRPYPTSFLYHDHALYAGYCGSVSKIDPATGKALWRVKMHAGAISPTVLACYKDVIYVAGAGHVVAVGTDGTVQWRSQFGQTSTRPVTILHSKKENHPLLYIGHRGKVHIYNTESQTQVKEWRSGTKSFVTLALASGVLVVGTPLYIWALQPKSMETIWKQSVAGAGNTVAIQVIRDTSGDDVVLACMYHNGERSNLVSFRLVDGSPRWGSLSIKSGFCNGSASIIHHDGYIIMGLSGGYIQGLHITHKALRFRMTFGRSWISFSSVSSSSDTHASQPIVQEQSSSLAIS